MCPSKESPAALRRFSNFVRRRACGIIKKSVPTTYLPWIFLQLLLELDKAMSFSELKQGSNFKDLS